MVAGQTEFLVGSNATLSTRLRSAAFLNVYSSGQLESHRSRTALRGRPSQRLCLFICQRLSDESVLEPPTASTRSAIRPGVCAFPEHSISLMDARLASPRLTRHPVTVVSSTYIGGRPASQLHLPPFSGRSKIGWTSCRTSATERGS